MAPLLDSQTGYSAGSDLGKRLEDTLSRPSIPMTGQQLVELNRAVEDGYKSWLTGDFPTAIETLSRAVRLFQASPAMLAQEHTRRDVLGKALVGLALAYKRQGQTDESTRAIAELIRSFPDREFNRTIYGPEAHDLYTSVKAELDEAPKGVLHIIVDDENAVVFLNGRYEAVGTVHLTDLVPGIYSIYIQRGSTPGRVHVVTVQPGKEETVSITWELDAALRTNGPCVGLSFSSEEERQKRESRIAAHVGRSQGAKRVMLVRIGKHDGRRAMLGTILSVETSKPLRSAMLALEPTEPGADQIAGLGEFLAGRGEAIPGLIVTEGALRSTSSPRPLRTWKWVAAGVGTAAIATGLVALKIDGTCVGSGVEAPPEDPQATGWTVCENLWKTKTSGIALIGSGIAVDVAALYMFVSDRESAPRRSTGRSSDSSIMPDEAMLVPSTKGVWVGARWGF